MTDPELTNIATHLSQLHGVLIAHVLGTLAPAQVDALDGVLKGGGEVGLETITNGNGVRRISLIAIEREGARRVLAHVSNFPVA